MKRRSMLRWATLPGLMRIAPFLSVWTAPAFAASKTPPATRSRVRPGQHGWPVPAQWQELQGQVDGNLIALENPFAACHAAGAGSACDSTFAMFANPFAVVDTPALAQNLGW